MKILFRNPHRQSGFSISELMVSAAILGILATLGTQQFREYNERARIGRAKTMLMEFYARNQTFRTHFRQYFGDWRNLGFQVYGDIEYRIGYWLSSPTISPVAPANYTGPGVSAGSPAVRTLSTSNLGCSGGICREVHPYACHLNSSCVWALDTHKTCTSTRAVDGNRRIMISINQAKVFTREEIDVCGM